MTNTVPGLPLDPKGWGPSSERLYGSQEDSLRRRWEGLRLSSLGVPNLPGIQTYKVGLFGDIW